MMLDVPERSRVILLLRQIITQCSSYAYVREYRGAKCEENIELNRGVFVSGVGGTLLGRRTWIGLKLLSVTLRVWIIRT